MEGNKDLDIKHFQQYPSGAENDRVLMVKGTTETPASLTLASLRNFLAQFITPSIRNDNWYIGETDTKIQAEGKTPMLRLAQNGIEYRYSEKENWAILVPLDKIKLHFTDLNQSQKDEIKGENVYLQSTNTEIQWKIGETGVWQPLISLEVLKLKFEDLAPTDITLLQQPALDINKELKTHPNKISESSTWLIWDAESKNYIDTRLSARGRSPKIISGIWWVWDDSIQDFVSTGQSVNSGFQLTKEQVEGVLTGDINSHNHETFINNKLRDYAKKSDLDNVQGNVTKEKIESVLRGDITSHNHQSQIEDALRSYATIDDVKKKQDKLEAGNGIDIINNVISFTLDSNIFIVVSELPVRPEQKDSNKIFVVRSSSPGQVVYNEYLWIDSSSSWKPLGEVKANVELSEYIKKVEANTLYQQKETGKGLSTNDFTDEMKNNILGLNNKHQVLSEKEYQIRYDNGTLEDDVFYNVYEE